VVGFGDATSLGPAGLLAHLSEAIVDLVDAGQEPLEDASEVPTHAFPVVARAETRQIPRLWMPDGAEHPRDDEDRAWKIAVGFVVLVGLGIVSVVLGSYLIRVGPLFAGADAALPEATGSSRVAIGPAASDGVTPTPASSQSTQTAGPTNSAGDMGPSTTAGTAPTTSPPGTPTSTRASSEPHSFSSAGGTILAFCSGSAANLVHWQPAADYRVKSVDPGPGSQAAVTFKSASAEITMIVTCVSGEPVVRISSKG
jgi:hypothetical protein